MPPGAQHVAEVGREVLQECLLGRADVAEDRRQANLTEQLVGDLPYRLRALCSLGHATTPFSIRAALLSRGWSER